MKITLYQIIAEFDTDRLMFNNFDYMRIACGNKIPAHLYEAVYSGEFDTERLDDIFYIFNQDFPDDYRGRSMSVSDVLEVIKACQTSWYNYIRLFYGLYRTVLFGRHTVSNFYAENYR